MASSYTKGGLDWPLGRISSQEVLQSIGQAVQGSGGGSIPEVLENQVHVALEDTI